MLKGAVREFILYVVFITSCYITNCLLQLFRTINGHRLTLNVLEMDIEPAANATLEVYDSCDYQPHKLIASFAVINNTLPMGVSSTFYCMFVRFTWTVPRVCPTQKDCVKFTILVDTSPEPGRTHCRHSLLLTGCNIAHLFFCVY